LLSRLKAFRRKVSGKFPVERMIFFGSRVRGDHLESSDVDLVIVSDAFGSLSFPRRLMALELLWTERLPLGPFPYTAAEFKRLSSQSYVLKEALRNGIEIN
jgi:predicted nucleotidyltransferase